MKKPNLRKSLAIFGAILTGGIGVAIFGLLPFAEDSSARIVYN
jgi:hypothetical protein